MNSRRRPSHRLIVVATLLLTLLAGCSLLGEAATPPSSPSPSAAQHRAWPLRVSENRRHLVTADNEPFLMVADTAWGLMTGLSVDDAKTYIDLRREQGYNTILTNVVFADRQQEGPRGQAFADGDVSRPHEAWFAGIDEIVEHARAQDVLIVLGTLWMKDNGGTVGGSAPAAEALKAYGRYLGERYADAENLLYFVGGDDDPALHQEAVAQIATSLKQADPHALITFHSWGKAPAMASAAWVDFYSFQWNSNSPPYSYADVRETAAYKPTRPVIDLEPAYDPDACCGDDKVTTEQKNRRNGWWAALSGAMGVVYGGPRTTWNAGTATEGQLPRQDIDRPAAHQTAMIGKVLGQLDWSSLEPDWDATTVLGDRGSIGSDTYVTAGRAKDGSLVVAYTPISRDLEVDLTKLSGPATARWYDPATGKQVGEAEAVTNTTTQTFTDPLPHDAVLVLSTSR